MDALISNLERAYGSFFPAYMLDVFRLLGRIDVDATAARFLFFSTLCKEHSVQVVARANFQTEDEKNFFDLYVAFLEAHMVNLNTVHVGKGNAVQIVDAYCAKAMDVWEMRLVQQMCAAILETRTKIPEHLRDVYFGDATATADDDQEDAQDESADFSDLESDEH